MLISLARPARTRPVLTATLGIALAATFAACSSDDDDDNGSDGGSSLRLEFLVQPAGGTSFANLASVQVRIVDEDGDLVAGSVAPVTLRLEENPGELLLHASGFSDPDPLNEERILEWIDPAIPAALHWLPQGSRSEEILALAYDQGDDVVLVSLRNEDFAEGDPLTGELTVIGAASLDETKGMAIQAGPPSERLLAVLSQNATGSNTDLYEIDRSDGTLSTIGALTPDTGVLDGFNGLTRDDAADTFWAAVNHQIVGPRTFGVPPTRSLMELFPDTLTVNLVGDMGESIAALASGADGTLYAVSGDGSTTPETLFTVDTTTAALTPLLTLGAGDDGEAITMVPARLSGTLTVNAVGGIATFDQAQLDAVASGYTLRAVSPGMTAAVSDPFDVTAPTPAGTVQFATSDQTVSEIDGTATVTVSLGAAQAHDIVVTMTASGTSSDSESGTPDHDLDYLEFPQVRIPAGATSADVTINLVDDADAEVDEDLVLFIEDASLAGAIGATVAHTLTIQSDE